MTKMNSKMNAPLLSIAIPCYNRPEELSLALQTFADQIERGFSDLVEVIITDDRSTDDTPKIGQEFAKKYPFIKFKQNKTNIGLEQNLINCTKPCKGEFLWIFGDDDYLEFDKSLEEILDVLSVGKHDFLVLNRKRRSKDLSQVLSENWMNIPTDQNKAYPGLRDFCLDKGLISIIGFISVNIFRRAAFVAVNPKVYFGTMYPQLGMMLEAFHSSPVLLLGKPHIVHRTATMAEKRAALGNKTSEKDFMTNEKRRNALYFSLPFIRLVQELIDKGAFAPEDITQIPENTVIQGLLIDFLANTAGLANDIEGSFSQKEWDEARAFFERLPLTVAQKTNLRKIWPEFNSKNNSQLTKLTFSVITPSYNQAEFLQETLDICQGQSIKPIEHFVFDPGSTDGSREIASKTPNITLVAEADEGQSDAINKGFLRVKGDIVAWVNSDDCYIDDLVFERVAERFDQADAPDIVYGKGIFEDENGVYLRDAYVNRNPESLPWRFQHEDGILQPALFMRRTVVEKVGLLTLHRHHCMDYEYWIRCVKAGIKFAFIDEYLARAKYHSSNKTFGERDKSYIDVCDMLIDQFGYANHIWLKRYAEYLAAGFDGVLTNAANQDDVDDAKIEYHYDRLLRAYNTSADTYALLNSKASEKGYGDTLRELKNRGIGPSTPCKTIPLDQDWERGHNSYTVANRRWAFEAEWKAKQIAKSHAELRKCIDHRQSDTCIIVGNGPSLNKIDMSLFEGHDVIVSNNVFLSPELMQYAKFYTVVNYLVAEQSAQHINQMKGVKKILPYWLAYCLNEGPETFFMDAVGHARFSTDMFKNMSWRHTVTFYNMHLAYGLGYRKVILTGFDHSYRQQAGIKEGETILSDEPDENHFNGKYFQGKKWQAADVDMMEEMYKLAKVAFEADGRQIINATVGGNLELFPRQELSQALASTPSTLERRPEMKPTYTSSTYEREDNASLDETDVIFEILKSSPKPGTMIDVGAHHGSALAPFQPLNWDIYAYEPDPKNRIHLERKFGDAPNVKIDTRAVSDKPDTGRVFYSSTESAGISGMLKFRDSHEQSTTVDVTTVDLILREEDIEHVEFLKIDVEGYDFNVLKGVPWDRLTPDVIESEFEDAKTVHLGHTWRDICEYLEARGYTVYVSEWHPIVRYGISHQWRALKRFPCELSDENAWGNLLAFKNDPGVVAIEKALAASLKIKSAKAKSPKVETPKVSPPISSTVSDASKKSREVATPRVSPPKEASPKVSAPKKPVQPETSAKSSVTPAKIEEPAAPGGNTSVIAETHPDPKPSTKKASEDRPAYSNLADSLRRRSPALFRIGQIGLWGLRFIKRHLLLSILGLALICGLLIGPVVLPSLASYSLIFWGLALGLVLIAIAMLGAALANTIMNRIAQREQNARVEMRREILASMKSANDELHKATSKSVEQSAAKMQSALSGQFTQDIDKKVSVRISEGLALKINQVEAGLEKKLNDLAKIQSDTGLQAREELSSQLSAFVSKQIDEGLAHKINPVEVSLEKRLVALTETQNLQAREDLSNQLYAILSKQIDEGLAREINPLEESLEKKIKELAEAQENTSLQAQEELSKQLYAFVSQQIDDGIARGINPLEESLEKKIKELAKSQSDTSLQAREELSKKLSAFISDQIDESARAKQELSKQVKDLVSTENEVALSALESQLNSTLVKRQDKDFRSLEDRLVRKNDVDLGIIKTTLNVSIAERAEALKSLVAEMQKQLHDTQKQLDVESRRNEDSSKAAQERFEKQILATIARSETTLESIRESFETDAQRNSSSFAIAQEQLEARVSEKLKAALDKFQAAGKGTKTKKATKMELESASLSLEKFEKKVLALVTKEKKELSQNAKNAEDILNKIKQSEVNIKSYVEQQKDELTQNTNDSERVLSKVKQLEELIAQAQAEISAITPVKEVGFQTFNRVLKNGHTKKFEDVWFQPLNLKLTRRSMGYMAERIRQIETNSLGRLATSIEDAMLRILVSLSVPGRTLHVLEIGTLFGIGATIIHDRTNGNFDSVHLTLVDPLEGYYGNNAPDILTNELVSRKNLVTNLAKASIPETDYTIIQGLSMDDEVIEAAAKNSYDVLIIDGDHSYAGVKNDFVHFAPFVKRGGYIIVDDYGTDHWPDIAKYVDDELMPRGDILLVGASYRTAVFKVIKRVKT